MKRNDPRIDAYIEKAQPFARPILNHLRALILKANSEVMETIKWGMPFFEYKGPLCNMAAFKQHAVLGFWKGKLLKDKSGYLQERANAGGEAMGNLGRITSLKDLPPDKVILDFVKQAIKLNEEDVKVHPSEKKPQKELIIPDYFLKALKKNKKAFTAFENFTPSKKREYIEWITEAKTEETRNKRMETSIEWISEGKSRNWKYETKKS